MPEFSFLTSICVSLLLGFLLGLEREAHHKAAGLRTYMLVTAGATLYTLVSIYGFDGDTSRVAAQIITGIGFIGAGTILHKKDSIEGLTTAAGLWAAAAIGMLVGVSWFWYAMVSTLLFVGVSWFNDKKLLHNKTGSDTVDKK